MPASFLKIGGELVQDATLKKRPRHPATQPALLLRSGGPPDRRPSLPDRRPHRPGPQIVTFGQDSAEHAIFDGFLLEGELEYEIFGNYIARLKGVTRSYKLDVAEEEIYCPKQTLAGIACAVAEQADVTQVLHCALKPAKKYVQWGQTAYFFLCRAADEHLGWLRPSASVIDFLDAFQPVPRSSGAPKAAC